MMKKIILSAVLVPLTALTVACGSDGSGGGVSGGVTGGYDVNAMLASIATNVVLPLLEDFQQSAQDLQTSATAYVNTQNAAELADAQDAWQDLMGVWQQLEVFQFGPAGLSSSVIGGQGLRDEIYSWPTTNSCNVDVATTNLEFQTDGQFFSASLVNFRGLDAIEYLLFTNSTDNTCSAQNTINTSGDWDALGDAVVDSRRADYALAAADNILALADDLLDEWSATGGNFAGELSNAGASGSLYSSAHKAANDVYFGMFYLELNTKDEKLGVPAGLIGSGGVDAEQLESQFAQYSKEHVLNNLRGFQKLFLGDAPGIEREGFDDYLAALGASALADEMEQDIEDAITAVQAVSGTFNDALTNDFASVEAAFNAVKAVTYNLKSQFPSVLSFEVPLEGAGDND